MSLEREALFSDQLNQALAAHNGGGLVIVQVRVLWAGWASQLAGWLSCKWQGLGMWRSAAQH